MATLSHSLPHSEQPAPLLRTLWRVNWPLTLFGLASLILMGVAAVGIVVDPRLITGAPAWVKPLKFAISTVFYAFTLVWMLGYVKGHPRLIGLIGATTALALVIELALIILQVTRGVRSHFNFTTPFDGALFSIMGAFIIVVWVMNLLAAVLLMRQPLNDAAFAWALRLGLLIALVGAGVAFLMTGPTPAQMAEMQAGQQPLEIGAHSVGVTDGGPGLPFVGWSTEGGDLRVAHFVGLHALQVLPFAGFVINRLWGARLSERRRAGLVWAFGLGYLGLTLSLAWQALRGQSVIAPDALTLAAWGGLAALVTIAVVVIALPARRA